MSAVLPPPPPPSAARRLAQSREQLRLALQAAAPPASTQGRAARGSVGADPAGAAARAPTWLDTIRHHVGVRIVIDVVQSWWARHPARPAVAVAAAAASATIQPIAQRHPLALVTGAALVGGLIVWSRPWRWARPALLAGLLPQLLIAAFRAAPAEPDRPRRR